MKIPTYEITLIFRTNANIVSCFASMIKLPMITCMYGRDSYKANKLDIYRIEGIPQLIQVKSVIVSLESAPCHISVRRLLNKTKVLIKTKGWRLYLENRYMKKTINMKN